MKMPIPLYHKIRFMKRISFVIGVIATVFVSGTFAQTTTNNSQPVLSVYYEIRNALVAGKPDAAATKAEELKTAINSLKSLESRTTLQKTAGLIASSAKNLAAQRDAFATLSIDMLILAKAEKLSTQPIYQLTCPMKKASWLSSEKTIKNPYYGSAMLSCGRVAETL